MTMTAMMSIGVFVGGISGGHAARLLAGRYARHGLVALSLSLLGVALGIGVVARTPVATAVACLPLLAVALPLSTTDAVTRRLPDRLALPAIVVCTVLLVIAATRTGDYGPLWRALAASAVVFLCFTALALAAPGALGFGDCKAAALCALPVGYLGWNHVLIGIFAAYLLAAFYIIARRLIGTPSPTLAFGPFLFAGAFFAILTA